MLVWALAGLIGVNLVVFVLLLAGSRRRRVRGGQLDLTAAAARGELDLRWDWPTTDTGRREPLETGDDLRYPTTSAA